MRARVTDWRWRVAWARAQPAAWPVREGTTNSMLNVARKGSATLTIRNNVEIGQNSAQSGGGVANQIAPGGDVATVTVIDSAITNNSVSQVGGIFNVGGMVSLQTSTVFENTAAVTGGGVFTTDEGVVSLDNQSAVVENTPNNCVGTNARGA